ncbi:uncharacterized protein BJ171DRAFT_503468 [Polychytrium aggregatum]|uniref:uncharacterized protein n=1 Tax=Polychytrium aggregatum TaxID=110093 RepID=UPI0022FE7D8D|nr:uncharacterized protein BJ171DRAFT_503468 [Polychytrium aggregatum]KAI9204753.1 hypothetical protein BJ171DRAFT_503468 [Polychytrium aggregatum]
MSTRHDLLLATLLGYGHSWESCIRAIEYGFTSPEEADSWIKSQLLSTNNQPILRLDLPSDSSPSEVDIEPLPDADVPSSEPAADSPTTNASSSRITSPVSAAQDPIQHDPTPQVSSRYTSTREDHSRLAQTIQFQESKRFKSQNAQHRQEALARFKEDRERMKLRSTTSAAPPDIKPKAVQPSPSANETVLQIRYPNGTSVKKRFTSSSDLGSVFAWVVDSASARVPAWCKAGSFQLLQPFPRRTFARQDHVLSLLDAGLVPSGNLHVVPLAAESVDRAPAAIVSPIAQPPLVAASSAELGDSSATTSRDPAAPATLPSDDMAIDSNEDASDTRSGPGPHDVMDSDTDENGDDDGVGASDSSDSSDDNDGSRASDHEPEVVPPHAAPRNRGRQPGLHRGRPRYRIVQNAFVGAGNRLGGSVPQDERALPFVPVAPADTIAEKRPRKLLRSPRSLKELALLTSMDVIRDPRTAASTLVVLRSYGSSLVEMIIDHAVRSKTISAFLASRLSSAIVENLCLDHCVLTTDSLVEKLTLDHWVTLDRVSLKGCHISDQAVVALSAARSLQSLNLANCRVTDKCAYVFRELGQLRELDLSYTLIGTSGLAEIIDAVQTTLVSLSIGNCQRIEGERVFELLANTRLVRLNVSRLHFAAPMSPVRGSLVNALEYLDISGTPIVNGDVRLVVSSFRNLLELDLRGCNNLSAEGLIWIPRGQQHLQHIQLPLSGLPLDGILPKFTDLPLVKLDLEGAQVSNEGLQTLPRLSRTLEHLNLSRTKVDDAGLASVAGLLQLKELYLNHLDIHDEGMGCLLALPYLRVLSLAQTHVSDKLLDELTKSPMRFALKSLNLSHTPVRDAGVMNMLAAFSNLAIINLEGTLVTPGCVANIQDLGYGLVVRYTPPAPPGDGEE